MDNRSRSSPACCHSLKAGANAFTWRCCVYRRLDTRPRSRRAVALQKRIHISSSLNSVNFDGPSIFSCVIAATSFLNLHRSLVSSVSTFLYCLHHGRTEGNGQRRGNLQVWFQRIACMLELCCRRFRAAAVVPEGGRVDATRCGVCYRESAKKKDVRTSNIEAAKAVADSIRTSLGPRGMDKMVSPFDRLRGVLPA